MRFSKQFVWIIRSAILSGMLASCAHYPENPATDELNPVQILQEKRNPSYRSGELGIMLAFSGGGTRAAALAYGVLEALAEVRIPGESVFSSTQTKATHRLLDEVDAITSVSGGSFTATYYGLHGDRTFKDFRKRFLYRNVQRGLKLNWLNPFNFLRTLSPYFGRSDMAAEYYDRILFDGKTLGDMRSQSTPYIMIQATDALNGYHFPFTPYMFALICSDYDTFPVSRAVAASAAFPGPFTPIVLRNHAGKCKFAQEGWVQNVMEKQDATDRNFRLAKKLSTYANPEKKPYIYLLDGGVADNLGLRLALEITHGIGLGKLGEMGLAPEKKMLFVIVNAASQSERSWGRLGKIPGIGGMLGATSSTMVNATNYDTLSLLYSYFDEWLENFEANYPEMEKPELYVVVVEFDSLQDEMRRRHFFSIPTSLSLPDKTVDELRMVARELLFDSSEFKRFVNDIGGTIPTSISTNN